MVESEKEKKKKDRKIICPVCPKSKSIGIVALGKRAAIKKGRKKSLMKKCLYNFSAYQKDFKS